jgi:TatD DNase family protein
LIETDAPDQPDQQHAGKRNEPAYLVNTLDMVSQLTGETRDNIARQTTSNAKYLFKI